MRDSQKKGGGGVLSSLPCPPNSKSNMSSQIYNGELVTLACPNETPALCRL